MHHFQNVPPICAPADWIPRIDQLLSDIWHLLAPGQRSSFQITDIKEKRGGLRLYWYLQADVTDELGDKIDTLIDQASDELQLQRP